MTTIRSLIVAGALSVAAYGFATNIPGGNIINQTWTTAGSPYIVQGDITIPSGSFLHIDPGVSVQFASTDAQASGLNTGKVELTVNGELMVNGTAASPVTLRSAGAEATGVWYGIVVGSGASNVDITHADVRHGIQNLRTSSSGGVTEVTNSSFSFASEYGIQVLAGTPAFSAIQAASNTLAGVRVNGGGATITGALIEQNGGYGIHVASTTAAVSINQTTSDSNGTYGIMVESAPPHAVTIRNSIITNQPLGVDQLGTAPVSIKHSDVWNNGSNFVSVTPGVGTFSANPIYVSANNKRLTSNSPARFAGDVGLDIGGLPFISDPTPGLYGTLWSDKTLTVSGSPHLVEGDLTVGPGVELTVDPGVTLDFATTDIMAAYQSVEKAELRVSGSLSAAGTAGQPILFKSTGTAPGEWYGIHFLPDATGSTLQHAEVRHATVGVWSETSGTNTIAFITSRDHTEYGFAVNRGTLVLDAVTASGSGTGGVRITGEGAADLRNAVIRDNGVHGVYNAATAPGATIVQNSTIHANNGDGVSVDAAPGHTTTIRNSIITSHVRGVARSGSSTVIVTSSDVWNNSTNFDNVTAGAGVISADPRYVSAADLHLQRSSPCIDSGSATDAPDHDRDGVARPLDGDGIEGAMFDMGAYEHDDLTSTVLISSQNPSQAGQSVTFTATVTRVLGSVPATSGTVVFKDGMAILGSVPVNGSGVAELITSALSNGNHGITAHYQGSPSFDPSVSPAVVQSVQGVGVVRTWVATTGVDTNPCSRVSPCRSLATAAEMVNGGGEVIVLDSGGYGAVGLTSSVTILASPGIHAAIAPTTGAAITIAAGPADVVVLRGLYLNAQGAQYGINALSGGALHIESCVISGFSDTGVEVRTGGDAMISDTVVRSNRDGIEIYNNTDVNIQHVRLEDHFEFGLLVGFGNVSVGDSTAARNAWGFSNSGSLSRLALNRCAAIANTFGITADSSAMTVTSSVVAMNFVGLRSLAGTLSVRNSTVVGNQTGMQSEFGGVNVSLGGNRVAGNGVDGSFTSTSPPQ